MKTHPAGQPKSSQEAPYLYEFRSLGLNVPRYLTWLVQRLNEPHKDLPGPPVRFLRGYMPSLKAAAELVPGASVVINASGLGSKSLEDVRDDKVYPIRGQTVLVYAPRFRDPKYTRCYSRLTKEGATYVIPRARSGLVILGGTFDARKTDSMLPDAEVTERILKNCTELAPELLPDYVNPNDPTGWVTLDVIRNNVGVRPAREGGVRVELDKPLSMHGRDVGVVHAYGIGTCYINPPRSCWLSSQLWRCCRGRRAGRPMARHTSSLEAVASGQSIARDNSGAAGIKRRLGQIFASHRTGVLRASRDSCTQATEGMRQPLVSMSLCGQVGISVDRLAVADRNSSV